MSNTSNTYKLTLKNFKCFASYSVEIDKEVIILFDGPSGIGKSSLIQAFLFAITGEGKKLFKQGTKSLSVELENNGERPFKIVRKKGPESLCFYDKEKCYEDDEAQVRIDNYFGKNFNNTSVIKQKGENSFLSSSAKEKMIFLQSLLFSNSTIEKQKERVGEKIKCCKDEMNIISVKSNTISDILRRNEYYKSKQTNDVGISEKYTELSIEECNRKIESRQDKIKSRQKELQQLLNSLQDKQQMKTKYSNEEIKYKQVKSRVIIFEEQLQDVVSRIYNIKEKFNNNSYEKLLCDISSVRNKIKYIKLKTKCDDTQRVLIEQVSKTLIQLEKEEESIKNIINIDNIDETKYNDYCEKRDLIKKKRDISKKRDECVYKEDDINDRKESVNTIKLFLEKAELYKSSLRCPHCKNNVRLINSVLEKLETVSEDFSKIKIQDKQRELKMLEKELDNLENNKKLFQHFSKEEDIIKNKLDEFKHISVGKISELTDIINKIEDVKTTRRGLKKKKTELLEEKKKIVDFTHDQLKVDYCNLQKYEKPIDDEEIVIEEYEEKLSELLITQREEEKIKDELNLLEEKKRGISKEIKSIGLSIEVCDEKLDELNKKIGDLEDDILREEEEIQSLRANNKQSKWTNQIDELTKQKLFVEKINEVKHLEKELDTLQIKYKQVEKDCVNYNIISEGIEHSESVLLSKFIDTINHNLSIHLDAFFEEPMHVQIKSFKEGKTNKEKPVINLEIFYKGSDTDLTNLSGGEYDRLNLALTLTFNCISNSPILILDESLSSINQELSTEIIAHMKETISHKLVWMTQHQAVKGMFDKVFQIDMD